MRGIKQVSTPSVEASIARVLELATISPDKVLTLQQQTVFTGMSDDTLFRYFRLDPDWHDVMYAIGEKKSEYRTTLRMIARCQDRAAARTRARLATKGRAS